MTVATTKLNSRQRLQPDAEAALAPPPPALPANAFR